MIMNSLLHKKGDMVYIPSNVILFAVRGGNQEVQRYIKTDEPVHVILMNDLVVGGKYCEVLHNGSVWYVNADHTYNTNKGN